MERSREKTSPAVKLTKAGRSSPHFRKVTKESMELRSDHLNVAQDEKK